MNQIVIENNEFLRQFEVKISDSLARIEYAEQERKIFLTKIHIPDTVSEKSFEEDFIIKVLEFIESKNLRLSGQKCYQIHIGNGHQACPQLRVHEQPMKVAKKEKYLGDMIDQSSSIQATMDIRKSKGQGINTGIM